MKKLLLCILCSTIVTTFIGFTIVFIYQFPSFLLNDISMQTDVDSELLAETFSEYENAYQHIIDGVNQQKELYGDDYAGGRVLIGLTYMLGNRLIINTYIISLIVGITFGIFIYFIFIQQVTSKHIEIKIGISFIIILTLVPLINWIYTIFCNIFIKSTGTDMKYDMSICDLDPFILLAISLGLFFLILLTNLVYQKIRTYKLNKALEKK